MKHRKGSDEEFPCRVKDYRL